MNHNGVISLPVKASEVIEMGMPVEIHTDGTAMNLATSANVIGIALQDVKETESGRPVDIQLLSAGGIVLIRTGGTIKSGPHAISIGTAVKVMVGGAIGSTGTGTAIGTALEASSETKEFVRVVL
jgi:hypothetical protein